MKAILKTGLRRAGKAAILFRAAVILGVVCLAASPAWGKNYAFVKIADDTGSITSLNSYVISGGGRSAINDSGVVAFYAELAGANRAILAGSGGALTTIAETAGPFKSFAVDFYPTEYLTTLSINSHGRVAFFAYLDGSGTGMFMGDGTGMPTKMASGPPFSFGIPFATINDNDVIAFLGIANGASGVFASDGFIEVIIAHSSGPLQNFESPSINNAGQVAFIAVPDPPLVGHQVWVGDGSTLSPIADTYGPFKYIYNSRLNNLGTVAFHTIMDDGVTREVHFGNGGPTTKVADTKGLFSYFGPVDINDAGQTAFFAYNDDSTSGIYTGPDPIADKVVRVGDPCDGSITTHILQYHLDLNNRGQMVFGAALADGRIGIFRADPDEDADGVGDYRDNCAAPNPDQADADGDGLGNACDSCVFVANADQADGDGDGIGNACDNCATASNTNQADLDLDGRGDACDNCPDVPNTEQSDDDGDGIGNVCEPAPVDPDPGIIDGGGQAGDTTGSPDGDVAPGPGPEPEGAMGCGACGAGAPAMCGLTGALLGLSNRSRRRRAAKR